MSKTSSNDMIVKGGNVLVPPPPETKGSSANVNRYDSEEYLKAYQVYGDFPKIHADFLALVEKYNDRRQALDLCCATGLLGQSLIDRLHMPCVGVEGYYLSARNGPDYGVSMKVYDLRINHDTLPQFLQIIDDHQVKNLVARRCISEIFSKPDDPFSHEFVLAMMEHGVENVFLQGRQVSANSNHPMQSINEELWAFTHEGRYKLLEQFGQFAVCTRGNLAPRVIPPVVKSWGVPSAG